MIVENNIYLSYVMNQVRIVLILKILVAEINLQYLEFKPFFQDKECIERPPANEGKLGLTMVI